MSFYRMQVIDLRTGETAASWNPGQPVERDFIEAVVANIAQKGVGYLSSTARVQEAVRKAFTEELYRLKAEVKPEFS